MPSTSQPVLITGASGFLALHCIIHLLEQGYKVRGTLRTMSRETEVRETVRRFVQADDRLEFTPADLMDEAGWPAAMQGCDLVLHVASPFPLLEPKHEDELIKPAVEGTLRVLRAAHAARVKRVVQVSSNAAISAGHEGENRTFTEADWSRLDQPIGAYSKSKTLAEQAAWDFIRGAENTHGLQLAVINPPYILGPLLTKDFPTSGELLSTYMRRQVPGVARIKMGMVDVRDVAAAMRLAMTVPEAAGERFLCSAETLWLKDITAILHKHYAARGYQIPRLVIPVTLVRLLALFDKKVAVVTKSLNWDYELSNEKARRVLGWQPRSGQEAILAMAESLIELGFV
jgi:dihydroflavonol-4-reductase